MIVLMQKCNTQAKHSYGNDNRGKANTSPPDLHYTTIISNTAF